MTAIDFDYQIKATKRRNQHDLEESIDRLVELDRAELLNLCASLMTRANDMGDAALSARRPDLTRVDVDCFLAGIQYMAGSARFPHETWGSRPAASTTHPEPRS
jgi:hypothetical protein